MAAKRGTRRGSEQHEDDTAAKKRFKTQQTHKNTQRTSARQVTASQSKQSAARFFGITELLEKVLLEVGTLRELMIMRRVCHKWQDVIVKTRSLQTIIILLPQQLDHEWHGQLPYRDVSNLDPSMELVKKPIGTPTDRLTEVVTAARINPFLFYKKGENARTPIWHPWQYGWHDWCSFWTSEELFLRMDARPMRMKTSSVLLNMFATQPPLLEMTLRIKDTNHFKSSRRIYSPKGLRVIDVLRAAEQLTGDKALVVENVFFPPDGVDVIPWDIWRDRFYTDT